MVEFGRGDSGVGESSRVRSWEPWDERRTNGGQKVSAVGQSVKILEVEVYVSLRLMKSDWDGDVETMFRW